mmetsp:Transcript_26509/g.48533  ORF Transcript_26509/g.48533 Transcript_26509/m.48533 type:complete len:768 (+) Transcript_26509:89-2392(+)
MIPSSESQRDISQRDIESGERQALLPRTGQSPILKALFYFSNTQIYWLLYCLFLIGLSRTDRLSSYADLLWEFLLADVLYVWAVVFLVIITCIALSSMLVWWNICGCFSFALVLCTLTGCHYYLLRISSAHKLDTVCLADGYCKTTSDGTPDLGTVLGFFTCWLWLPSGLLHCLLGVLWRPFWLDLYVVPVGIFGLGPLANGGVHWWQWREAFIGMCFWFTLWVFSTAAYNLQESPRITMAVCIGFIASLFMCLFCFYLTVEPMVEFWRFLLQCWEHIFENKARAEEWFALLLMLLWMCQAVYKIISMRLDEWNAKQAVQEGLQYAYDHPFRADLEENFGLIREEGGAMVRTLSRLGSGVYMTPERLRDLKDKQAELHKEVRRAERESSMSTSLARHLQISVDRENLLKDSFGAIGTMAKSQLLAPTMLVQFKSEGGVDAGGLRRDWFESVARALLDGAGNAEGESLLAFQEDQTLLPRPRPGPSDSSGKMDERDKQLWAVGVFLALALYHSQPLPLSFSMIACKFFCGRKVELRDVERLDPDFYRNRVQAVLKPGGLEELNAVLGETNRLTWVSAPTRLRPQVEDLVKGGSEKLVTDDNKREYVQALCEAYLCNGIRVELQLMLNGFWHVIPMDCLRFAEVGPGDLSLMISGVQELDPQAWRACAEVTDADVPSVMAWFWEIVQDMSDQERCSLLHFVTGSSRLPPGGFEELNPTFKVAVTRGGEEDRLPISHTCVNQLVLQDYSSKEKLREKLLLAMQAEGFQFA